MTIQSNREQRLGVWSHGRGGGSWKSLNKKSIVFVTAILLRQFVNNIPFSSRSLVSKRRELLRPPRESLRDNSTTTSWHDHHNDSTSSSESIKNIDDDPIIQSLTTDFHLRYYMYTDESITYKTKLWTNDTQDEFIQSYLPFLNHPLRTSNPLEADLFFVPMPFMNVKPPLIESALQALVDQPTFQQQNDGHGHFFLAHNGRYFDAGCPGRWKRRISNQWATRLYNVTFVRDKDMESVKQMASASNGEGNGDWTKHFRKFNSLLRTSVSIGLVSWTLPFREASWERFQSQPYWIHYHCRDTDFNNNSTIYRRAPIEAFTTTSSNGSSSDKNMTTAIHNNNNNSATTFSSSLSWPDDDDFPVSIGYNLRQEEWVYSYTHSKFCLVIRGDDPNSKSLYRAVEVGCIPVVISDYLPQFAKPFPTSLPDMTKYCHFISEREFLQIPSQSLLSLRNLAEEYIRTKIYHLQIAQRIMSIKHPKSLFVPAILQEVHKVNPKIISKS